MEPVKAGRKGYHAVAKVDRIKPDPSAPGMHLAIIDPNSFLDFDHEVPFQSGGDYPERSVLNEAGNVSGRAQAAVCRIPAEDFNRIVALGLDTHDELLPRFPGLDAISARYMRRHFCSFFEMLSRASSARWRSESSSSHLPCSFRTWPGSGPGSVPERELGRLTVPGTSSGRGGAAAR